MSAAGSTAAAAQALAAALDREPGRADLYARLDAALRGLGDAGQARSAWSQLAARHPGQSLVWRYLAAACSAVGDGAGAATSLERAAALSPDDAAIWRALGGLHAEAHRFEPARTCLERALALEPGHDECASLLGWVHNELGDAGRALAVLAPPTDGRPAGFGRRLRHALLLPQVYDSGAAVRQWRQRYAAGLADLHANLDAACPDPGQVFRLNQTNYLLAYQGENDLELQRGYARLLRRLIERARPDLVAPVPLPRRTDGRIRVAFVSGFFHACTIGHYFRSWIEGLDPARFDTAVVHTGAQADDTTRAIATAAGQFRVHRGDALALAQALRELAADILIYPEVGMQSRNYLLANLRLAPIQCAAWGHPVTTGSGQIDYWFSCADMEPPDGDAHYSETVLRLPGLGTRYRRPEPGPEGITRESLGLPTDRRLYLCPQSLFKVHPDNDRLYLDILAADPQAVLVFFQETAQPLTMAFANRLARTMAERGLAPRNQIKFLPRLDPAAFRAVLALADVVLDTLHWSGGNTSLDAIAAGVPIVTLPGAYMRGRQSQAMLKTVGVAELVAASEEDYVALALRVAGDRAWGDQLRRTLQGRGGELFDRQEPLEALSELLARIHEGG
jgi:CRISPR-associated protein Csy1